MVRRWKKLEKITKADIVAFAQKHIRSDNFVVVYKHQGEDNKVMKVEKPPITPIEVNRSSNFAIDFLSKTSSDIEPVFVDFKKVIKKSLVSKSVPLRAVQDKKSKLFRLNYCFDMGKTADRRLGVLAGYINYLGTSSMTPAEVQSFYRLGLNLSANCQDDHFYLTLSGLSESFEPGVALLESFIQDAQPNTEALANLVEDILLRRINARTDKRTVLGKAMVNYAKYGSISPFTDKLNAEQLKALKPNELTDLLHGLMNYKHEIFYFGDKSARVAAQIIKNSILLKQA